MNREVPRAPARPSTGLAGFGVGTWSWDVAGRTIDWSPEIRTMYGMKATDETGPGLSLFLDRLHPADRAPVMAVVSETLATRRDGHEHTFRIVRPNGEVRRILSRARLILDDEGAPALVEGVDIDLGSCDPGYAERELMHDMDRLRTTVHRFAGTLNTAPVVLFAQDLDLRYTWIFNPALGFEPGEVIGRTDADLFGEQRDFEKLHALKRAVLQDARPRRGEVRMEQDGKATWYDLYVSPHHKDGQLIGLVCTAFELTERMNAQAALAESEARYRALFSSIDEGYCLCEMITDAAGSPVDYRFLEVNPLFEERTGLSNASGRTALELVPDLERHWIDTYASVGIGRQTLRFKAGSEAMGRQFDVFAGPAEPHGRFVIVFRDITEQTRQTERIRLLMREVTHRTKNILSVVQAVARQTTASDPEDFKNRFSERVAALAASHDLLVDGNWSGVDLMALVRSQLDHFSDLVGARIEIDGPRMTVATDAAEAIGMALHELATNAGKYGALSDDSGRVEIRWSVENERFNMHWAEQDGPVVEPPSGHGFGSTVIQRLVEMSLDAAVQLEFARTGLIWRLDAPANHVISLVEPGEEPDAPYT